MTTLRTLRSPLALLGLLLTLAAGSFHLVLFLLDVSGGSGSPYLNIFYYIVLPTSFFVGLALFLWGRKRALRNEVAVPALSVAAIVGTAVTAIAVVGFTGYSSYSVYHYSESTAFCGAACHEPMHPTFAAYSHSPHQRIGCTRCHVGEGPAGFIAAKISGTRQLLATAQNTFSRPISPERDALNVPRESCGGCHDPSDSSHFRLVHRTTIASDEANTFRPLFLALKTVGPSDLIHAKTYHWHPATIEYAATDDKAREIPWVRASTTSGALVYRSDGQAPSAGPPGEVYAMQCIDCHNRVGHFYKTPTEVVDALFVAGKLDYTLPYLKREATRFLAGTYDGIGDAKQAIESGITSFYRQRYSDLAQKRQADIDAQITTLTEAYGENFFPSMHADWRAYPDNSQHKYSRGCFRCHDGKHVTDTGKVLPSTCTTCHVFYEREKRDDGDVLIEGKYHHPFDLSKAGHDRLTCSACHDGGPTPPPNCIGCHDELAARRGASVTGMLPLIGHPTTIHRDLTCVQCHGPGERQDDVDRLRQSCISCHDASYATTFDEERTRLADALRSAREVLAQGRTAADPKRVERVIESLSDPRAHHNLEASLRVLNEVTRGAKAAPK